MKKEIHPEYNEDAQVICTTCGNKFKTGSVLSEIRVDTCSKCHPHYTGQQKFAQADGRVEKFLKRYDKKSDKKSEQK